MVISNYEGKTGQTMGVIQVDVTVGVITLPTIFMVITSMASYNLLLGREWICGVGVVTLSLHQKIAIGRKNEIVENVGSKSRVLHGVSKSYRHNEFRQKSS